MHILLSPIRFACVLFVRIPMTVAHNHDRPPPPTKGILTH